MFSIRRGTFETNSSSTHSIVVAKENRGISFPEKIYVKLSDYEFGWEYDKYCTVEEKIAYITYGITAISYVDGMEVGVNLYKKLLDTIGKWVKSVHIDGLALICYDQKSYFDEIEPEQGYSGYVDHAYELKEFVEAILGNEELLKRFIFSTDSFISTGNDNEYGYPEIGVKYPYDVFYKGN